MLNSILSYHPGVFGGLLDRLADGGRAGQKLPAAGESITPTAVAPAEDTGASGFEAAAKDLVNRALDSLTRDLGKLLKGLGGLAEIVQGLVESALQPVREALEQGQDFTAEIRLAAVRQQTLVTESGATQDLQILARSLTIEVNHSTGEIAIDLQSLSIEQNSTLGFAGQAPQLAAAPQGPDTAGPDGGDAADHGLIDFVERLLREINGSETAADDPQALQDGIARPLLIDALQDSLPGAAHNDSDHSERTRFALRGAERFKTESGQFVTRLRLEVAVQLATQSEMQKLLESLPASERDRGLKLSA